MHDPVWASPAEAERIARDFPSYCDFVDAALFDPAWGYYGSGQVRFGDTAHFVGWQAAAGWVRPFGGRIVNELNFGTWYWKGG